MVLGAAELEAGLQVTLADAAEATELILTVTGPAGELVRVESSVDLGAWLPMAAGTTDGSGRFQIRASALDTLRFFRAAAGDTAPIYSENVVGHVSLTVPAGGGALVANPLLGADPTIGALLPQVSNGVSLFKVGGSGYTANNFLAGWSEPGQTLPPGEGAWLVNPTPLPLTLRFKGDVPQGRLVNHLPTGLVLCGSIAPRVGGLRSALGFPVQDGDFLFLFSPSSGAFEVSSYHFGEWLPREPVLGLGQAFWAARPGPPVEWTQTFAVTGDGGGQYSFTPGVAGSPVAQLHFFTFHPDPSRGRVFDTDGTTPLSGGFAAQLYVGTVSGEEHLLPVGSPATFLSGAAAGYVRAGTVVLPGMTAGQPVYAQLRVWESAGGPDRESGPRTGGKVGRSTVVALTAGGLGSGFNPPPPPPNVNTFPVFALQVLPVAPIILVQPQGRTVAVGETVTLMVTATSEPPPEYQWRKDGLPIAGATGPTLTLSRVQARDAGRYDVVVSNLAGSVTSAVAELIVLTCAPAPPGLVSWYKFEAGPEDSLGAHHPVAASGLSFVPGQVGAGVAFAPGGFIDIPHAPSLAHPQLTVLAWVRPDGPGPTEDGFGSAIINKLTGGTSASLWINWDSGSGKFLAGVGERDTSVASAQSYPAGQFHHVAASYDGAVFTLYVNGLVAAQTTLNKPIVYDPAFPWTIGANPPPLRQGFPRTWNGVIDEVLLFDRALNSEQVAAVFTAGAAGVCPLLRLLPPSVFVPRSGSIQFAATGGHPPYQFAIVNRPAYGTIDPATGFYVAGPEPGTDTVRVVDAAGASATALVTILDCVSLEYDAAGNTLPSAQGWLHRSSGLPETNYSLAEGALVQADTAPADQTQFYQSTGVEFDFTTHTVVAEATVRIRHSGLRPPGADSPAAGWGMKLTDAAGRAVTLFVGSSGCFLLGQDDHASSVLELDTTAAFHSFFLVVGRFGATVSVDPPSAGGARLATAGFPALHLSFDQLRLDTASEGSSLILGDLSPNQASSSELQSFRLATRCLLPVLDLEPPEAVVAPGASLTFRVIGGQPPFTFTFLENASGGVLTSDGRYTAGPRAGADVVRVTDALGNSASAVVIVNPPCLPPPAGLAGWFRGEGNAFDQLGQQDGTVENGARFAPGQVGLGFQLDGVDDFIRVPHAPALAAQGSFTWALWIQPFLLNNAPVLITKEAAILDRVGLQVTSEGALRGFWDSGEYSVVSPPGLIAPGRFTHVAFVFDDDADQARVFVNGVLAAERTEQRRPRGNTADLLFGKSALIPGHEFNGQLDEIALFDRALSAAEVAALHAAGSAGMCSPPPLLPLDVAPIPDVTLGDVTRGEGVPVSIQPGQSSIDSLRVTVTSSNPDLVPVENLQFDRTGLERRLFIFPVAGRSGRATVTLTVMDEQGRSVSRSFTVTVWPEPPRIIAQPDDQTVVSGQAVLFHVSARGSPPLGFQWRRNGAPLPGATEATLHLPAVTTADRGDYDVVVSNGQGAVTSAPARLTVLEPPQITAQPESQAVPPGASVTLRVAATGAGALRYQWRHNGFNLPGATNPELILPGVRAADAGSYSVVVSSPFGAAVSAEAAVVLLVDPLPFADDFAQRGLLNAASGSGQGDNRLATKEPGEPHHAGQPGGRSVWVSWQAPANGAVTFDTRGSSFDTLLAAYVGDRVDTLQRVASDDRQGGFDWSTVSFNVSAGTTYHLAVDSFREPGAVLLNWVFAPAPVLQITRVPQSQTVPEGANVAFSVEVFNPLAGTTTLAYQWRRNGVPIAGATAATLQLNNVTVEQTGQYSVEVHNGVLAPVSAAAELQINQPPAGPADRAVFVTDRLGEAVDLSAPAQPQRLRLAIERLAAPHGAAPARGYSGAQVFHSFGSSTEVGEPALCGVLGGASRWFTYVAPASGTLTVSTDGSDFDTVLGIFTGPGVDFESLVLVACDNDGGADGQDSLARLEVIRGTTYFVAVDGVNGATGAVKLTYTLTVPHRLGPAQATADDFRLVLQGAPGVPTTIEASLNLRHWVPLLTTNTLTGLIEFVDRGRPGERRFYRAVQGP